MPIQQNICTNLVIEQRGDKIHADSFPPIENDKNDDNSIVDNIQRAVFRSTHFSSKFANKCEISNNCYINSDVGLMCAYLKGAQQLRNHHCYGCIQYHSDYENYIKDANMFFEYQQMIIQNHNWCDKTIKIKRSNGDVFETKIFKNSIIRYYKDKILFYVEFENNGEICNKWVPLTNYISERTGIETFGLLTLNPNLIDEELILYIGESPEWMKEERQEWNNIFDSKFKEICTNYSEFKYRFSNEDKY